MPPPSRLTFISKYLTIIILTVKNDYSCNESVYGAFDELVIEALVMVSLQVGLQVSITEFGGVV